MKVAIVGPYYPQVGGVQVYSTMLAIELLRRGFSVTVVSYSNAQPYSKEKLVRVRTPGIKIVRGLSFILGASLHLESFDVVLAQYATTSGTAAFLAKMLQRAKGRDLKYLVTFHGSDANPWLLSPIWKALVKSVGKSSAGVITVSHYLKEVLQRIGLEVKEVIPGGINREIYSKLPDKEGARRELGLGEGPLIISAGSLKRPKRFDLIPEIASKVEATFLVLGEGPMRRLIEEKASELGVKDRVKLVGKVRYENVPLYYRAADILLHPVEREGYGLVAMEALAAGTPVVASKVGGIPEVVEDGVTGYLVDPKEGAEAFSDRLLKLLSDERLVKRFGEEGRRRYLNRDWGVVAESYVRVIS